MASYDDLGNGFGVLRDDEGNIAHYTNRPPQPQPQQPQSTSYQINQVVPHKKARVDDSAVSVKQAKLWEEITDETILNNMYNMQTKAITKDITAYKNGALQEKDLQEKYGSKYKAYINGDFSSLKEGFDEKAVRSAINTVRGQFGSLTESATGGVFEAVGIKDKKTYKDPLTGQETKLGSTDARVLEMLLRAGIPSYVDKFGEIISIHPKTKKKINWKETETIWDMGAQAIQSLPGLATSLVGGAVMKGTQAVTKYAPKLATTLGVADIGYISGQGAWMAAYQNASTPTSFAGPRPEKGTREWNKTAWNKFETATGAYVNIVDGFESTLDALGWATEQATDGVIGTVVAHTVLQPAIKQGAKVVKSTVNTIKDNPKAYTAGMIASNTLLPPVIGQIASPFIAHGAAKLAKATVGPRTSGKRVEEGIIREGLDKVKDFSNKVDNVADELLKMEKDESFMEGLTRNTIGKTQKPLDETKQKIYEAGRNYQGVGKGLVRGITDRFSPNNNQLSTVVRRIDDELEYLHELYPILKDPNRVTEMVEQAKNLGFVPEAGSGKDFKVLLTMASQPGSTRFWEAVSKSSAMSMSNMNHFLRAQTAAVKNNILQLQRFTTIDNLRQATISNITSLAQENKNSLRALARGLDQALGGKTVTLDFHKFGLTPTTTYKTAQRKKNGDLVEIELNTLGNNYAGLVNHLGNGAQPLFLDAQMATFKTGKAATESASSAHALDYSKSNYGGAFHTYNTNEFSGKKGSELRAMLKGMEKDYYNPGQLAEMYINLKILGNGKNLDGNKDYSATVGLLRHGIEKAINNPALAEDYFTTMNEVIATTLGLERMARTDLWRILNTSNISSKDLVEGFTRAAQKLDLDGYSELQQLGMLIKGPESDTIKKSLDSIILDGIINKTMVADSDKTIYNCVQALDLLKNLHFQTTEARLIKEGIQAAGTFFSKELFGLTDIATRRALFNSGISSDYVKRAKVAWVSSTFKKIPALFSGTEAGKEERITAMAVRALTNKFDFKATQAFEKYMANNKTPTYKEIQLNNIYSEIKSQDIAVISALRNFTDDVKTNSQAYRESVDATIDEILQANGIDALQPSALAQGAQNITQVNLDRLTSSAMGTITSQLSDIAAQAGKKLDGDFIKSICRDDDFVNVMVDTVYDAIQTQNKATNLVDLGETVMTMVEKYEAFLKRNGKLSDNEFLPYDIEQIERAIQKKTQTNSEIQDLLGE